MKKGKIFLISGPSGVGKGTIREFILNDKSLKMQLSISCTTRKPRVGEQDGVDYYYIEESDFVSKIAQNQFVEHVKYVGNRYGTLKSELERITMSGHNVFLEIEIVGALKVIAEMDVVSIFILPPDSNALYERLKNRGTESEEVIKDRLHKAQVEMEHKNDYKYQVINDNLQHAVEQIKNIIIKETQGE